MGANSEAVFPLTGGDNMADRPKVALVLGAGSARGLAHIGVLQVFEENNIPFDLIVGSSMGAMVGGIMPVALI